MITAWIEGDRALQARFERIPETVRDRLRKTVESLALNLVASVQRSYLSGQALKAPTGTLRRSINEKTTATDTTVEASVGPNMAVAKYAAFQEFGYHGTESVREHLRLIKQAFGRPIAAQKVTVSAHTRKVNYGGHPYMRPAFETMRPQIVAEISRVVGGL